MYGRIAHLGYGKTESPGFKVYGAGERPIGPGGLTPADIRDLLHLALASIATRGGISDDERAAKLALTNLMLASLHYRFEKDCDHERWGCPFRGKLPDRSELDLSGSTMGKLFAALERGFRR